MRGMKTILLLLAQITTLTFPFAASSRQQNIQVLAGETLELLTWAPSPRDAASLSVDGVNAPLFIQTNTTCPIPVFTQSFVVAGPKTISLEVGANRSLVVTYKLTPVSTVATLNVASQVVVIPENAPAPLDVILESSTDLINWTAAVAGSYAPSTSKRFFRVRLVAH